MAEHPSDFIKEAKRRFNRTEELFARSISLWDDLERVIKSTPYTFDEWTEIAQKMEGPDGIFFSSYLQAMKNHLASVKKRKHLERARDAHFNTIPPSRLIKKV